MNQLIGHELVTRMLGRAVGEDRVRHAYLFSGPARVGKSTLARWLALRLNCTGPAPPCGACKTCQRILSGTHPDVRALQLAGDRDPSLGLAFDVPPRSSRSQERVISIEQVWALQHDASLAPREARWKVYLVVGAESLSREAANCLLKTLEEPSERVVLVLTAIDPADLLPTVVSRCQAIRLAPVAFPTIAAGLVATDKCAADRADLIARLSGGRPGWAIEAVAQPAVLDERNRALDDLGLTLGRGFRDRLGLAERLAADYSRDQTRVFQTLNLWQLYWWDVQLIQQGCADHVTNVDRREDLDALAVRVPDAAVLAYLRALSVATQRLLQNVNPRLTLETLLVTSPVAR
ncbi:MAG TPA: DNA polymerase III subunit delta' C-terminal domain-containing protein [Chloroflexota bacterium]|nr:DNA polymerase III subunit delta' C-terminal domain-containing protein [Chloroflexota bacterium]